MNSCKEMLQKILNYLKNAKISSTTQSGPFQLFLGIPPSGDNDICEYETPAFMIPKKF